MNKSIKKNTITQLTLLSSAALLLALVVISQPSNANGGAQDNDKQSSDRRGPPPEAFTVCEGKSAGDTAQFETPRGKMLTGSCEVLGGENAGKLVLRPDNHSNKQKNNSRRTPPAEAFTACEGKSVGEVSQFEDRRGEILSGTCEETDNGLVLRPERSKS